jgi:hypothetical protein
MMRKSRCQPTAPTPSTAGRHLVLGRGVLTVLKIFSNLPGEQAKRFLSAQRMIYGHFRPRRHLMPVADYRQARAKIFRT